MTTSERIKNIIKYLGMNNSSFASAIGVASTTVDGYIKGRRNSKGELIVSQPNYDVIKSIVEKFNVNADYVLGIDKEMFSTEKYSLDDFSKSEILDYLLENRKEFMVETKKIDLVLEVLSTMDQRMKIEQTNAVISELKELLKKSK